MDIPALSEEIATLRSEKTDLNKVLKKINERLAKLERQLIEAMNAQQIENFKNEHGNFGITHRFTVRVPQNPDSKRAFFDYLKERNQFEGMATIQSNTLNKWYKDEIEAAKARGDFDFQVPGIEEAGISEYLSVRKA